MDFERILEKSYFTSLKDKFSEVFQILFIYYNIYSADTHFCGSIELGLWYRTLWLSLTNWCFMVNALWRYPIIYKAIFFLGEKWLLELSLYMQGIGFRTHPSIYQIYAYPSLGVNPAEPMYIKRLPCTRVLNPMNTVFSFWVWLGKKITYYKWTCPVQGSSSVLSLKALLSFTSPPCLSHFVTLFMT